MEIQAEAWVLEAQAQAQLQKLLFWPHGQKGDYALINEGERPKMKNSSKAS